MRCQFLLLFSLSEGWKATAISRMKLAQSCIILYRVKKSNPSTFHYCTLPFAQKAVSQYLQLNYPVSCVHWVTLFGGFVKTRLHCDNICVIYAFFLQHRLSSNKLNHLSNREGLWILVEPTRTNMIKYFWRIAWIRGVCESSCSSRIKCFAFSKHLRLGQTT